MYPWISHMITHLDGECPHKCSYCYVDNPRFGRPERFKGPIKLNEDALAEPLGVGRVIFVEHMTDLFAYEVPIVLIERILEHCAMFPCNQYVFQTKNVGKLLRCWQNTVSPIIQDKHTLVGTTIETNRFIPLTEAPITGFALKAHIFNQFWGNWLFCLRSPEGWF
jgi:protein gp37